MAPLNFKIKPPQITLPVLALLMTALLVLGGVVGFTMYQMDEQDRSAKSHQIELVLQAELQRIINGVKAYANWDDSVRNFFGTPNPEWVKKNFDAIVLDEQKIDHFFVFNEHDQLIHKYPDAVEHEELLKHLQTLLPKFREISEKDAGFTPGGIYLDPEYGVFLVSMRRITAVDENIPKNFQHGILVFVDELIGDQLEAILKRMTVESITGSPTTATDDYSLARQIPLAGIMGEHNGYIVWNAKPPSEEFLHKASISLGFGLFAILCLAGIILYREQAAIHNLVKTEGTIQMLAAAVDASRTPMVILSRDGLGYTINYTNPSFQKLSGFTADDVDGKDIAFLEGTETNAVHSNLLQSFITEAKAGKLEILHRRVDGSQFWNEVILSPIVSDARKTEGFVAIMRDMTQDRRARESANQRDRMLSLGQMAGSVAHELNNLLQPVMTYGELLQSKPDISTEIAQTSIANMISSTRHATQIIRNVLAFSRQGEVQLEVMPFGDAIKRGLEIIRPLMPPALTIRIGDLSKINDTVRMNDGQMGQLLSQLLMNASWATDKRGSIGINLRKITGADAEDIATRHALSSTEFADLTIADNGIGMSPEVLSRALEPFFTTQPSGHGTGLGLSMVDSIVKSWGGVVHLESQPGEGTIVHVIVPLVK